MQSPEEYSGGSCVGCGYPLRGLSAARCPECGRAFDPQNPKTFRSGTPISRVSRLILKPIGIHWVVLALIAAGLAFWSSGWPSVWRRPFADFSSIWSEIRNRKFAWTGTDGPLVLCAIAAIVIAFIWFGRFVLQTLVIRYFKIAPEHKPIDQRRRHALLAGASLGIAVLAAFSWPFRLARRWIARSLAYAPRPIDAEWEFLEIPPGPPPGIDGDNELAVLRSAVLEMRDPRERFEGIKLLFAHRRDAALPILREALRQEKDPDLLVCLLFMTATFRDAETLPLVEPLLSHRNEKVSAAAIDAIDIIHEPSYPTGHTWTFPWRSGKPVDINTISISVLTVGTPAPVGGRRIEPPVRIEMPPRLRDRLVRFMLEGPSIEQRQAAARALVMRPPPNYRLRIAEWGVMIAHKDGFALPLALLDEIPPFVHQTGNAFAELRARVSEMRVVYKPIVHITTDQPLSIDLEVYISDGRPWVAYPMPDDFALAMNSYWGQRHFEPASTMDNPKVAPLKDLSEGYLWTNPRHRTYSTGEVRAIGVRWQSMIVSPVRYNWMPLTSVPSDPKFTWWTRLRDVPSSWVWNRNETERFAYYDGPTAAPAPATVERSASSLRFTVRKPTTAWPPQVMRVGLLIERNDRGLRWQRVTIPIESDEVQINSQAGTESEAADQLLQLLTAQGLTEPEAAGLIDAWRPQFFAAHGSRFILLMHPKDYEQLCPIHVRPAPTEMVRVGIIMTEFPASPSL